MSAASAHCMLPLSMGDSSLGSMPEPGKILKQKLLGIKEARCFY
jgi:hypothetical protein